MAGLGAKIGADARGISTIIVDSGTSRDECLNELPVSGGGSQPSASSDDPTPVRRGVGAVRHHRQREHLVRRSRYRDRVRSARLRVSDIAKSTGDGDAETSCTSPGLSLIRPGRRPVQDRRQPEPLIVTRRRPTATLLARCRTGSARRIEPHIPGSCSGLTGAPHEPAGVPAGRPSRSESHHQIPGDA